MRPTSTSTSERDRGAALGVRSNNREGSQPASSTRRSSALDAGTAQAAQAAQSPGASGAARNVVSAASHHSERPAATVPSRPSPSSPSPAQQQYNLALQHHTTKLQKKKTQPAPTEQPPAKEPKKKRRLFGLISAGSDSSPSASSSQSAQPQPHHSSISNSSTSPTSSSGKGFFGRSISTRSRPLSYQGSQTPSASSRSPSVDVDKESYFPAAHHPRPEPIAEEGLPASSTNRSNPAFRHSIAILPPPATDLQHLSPLSSVSSLHTTFNLSTTQFHEEGASWSERGKAPASQHPYSSSYLSPDSRPSSRQSLDQPTSPSHPQYIPYHHHKQVSTSSVNKLDPSREPSPLPQAPTHPRNPGQPGDYLHPDSERKPQPRQIAQMVQENNARGATPPPSKSKEDLASLDFPQLLAKHEELNDKYRKVKKYYFEKDGQVQQLQNTLAHQRLAQSRTSLDDNEYANRFQRLDGAINNLAFNVRKDWKAVPPWLSPYVNNDATTKVTKEMTAVGRACISRWLVDEIFDRVFHPGLEPGLSASLKIIERNLRRFSPPVNTDEERDALLTKISNWRLATLDGLAEALNSPQAADYRTDLTRGLVETLTSDLQMNLTTPPPAGLEAGVVGIIELAVGVAANLPLESRDVYVEYILPGIPLNDAYMKHEGNLPPLIHPGESYGAEQDQHLQQQRRGSADEPMGGDDQGQGGNAVIGGFVGAGPKDKKGNGHSKKGEEERKEVEKVRFAAFMSVMVKGKSMLVKAPVYV